MQVLSANGLIDLLNTTVGRYLGVLLLFGRRDRLGLSWYDFQISARSRRPRHPESRLWTVYYPQFIAGWRLVFVLAEEAAGGRGSGNRRQDRQGI